MPGTLPAQSQDAVFAFLSDPATHGGTEVTRIDTHGAAVFLAGDHVFKVKRAVRFPFLDYSTLDKRKAACEAELAINRRTAPEIYRRVVAITKRDGGGFEIGGSGDVMEWALEMRRFDESMTLDHLADRGEIDLALADTLGRVIAGAHRDAPIADAGAWIDALGQYIEQNDAAFAERLDLFPARDVAMLTDASRAHFAEVRAALDVFDVAYEVTPRLVRGLDYYTNTVFEIVSEGLGSQNAICGGGAYEKLVEELGGPATYGVGFAIGEDRLLDVLPGHSPARQAAIALAPAPVIVVAAEKSAHKGGAVSAAFACAERLRRAGVPAVEGPAKVEKAIDRATTSGAAAVVLVSEDGQLTARWTASGDRVTLQGAACGIVKNGSTHQVSVQLECRVSTSVGP